MSSPVTYVSVRDMCRSDLEDEVMTLRAQLQAMTTERDMWKKRAEELAIEKVFGRVI
jgi:hypothetical protein